MEEIKYPKAGTEKDVNPVVNLFIYDFEADVLSDPLTKPMDEANGDEILLGRVTILPLEDWQGNRQNDRIFVQWLNRIQTHGVSYMYEFDDSVKNISCSLVDTYKSVFGRSWITPNQIYPTSDDSQLLTYLQIQSDGYYNHIFRIYFDDESIISLDNLSEDDQKKYQILKVESGNQPKNNKIQISAGQIDVTKIYAIKPNYVYYESVGPDAGWCVLFQAADTPQTRQIYSINLNNGPSWNKIESYPVTYNLDPYDEPTADGKFGVWYCFTCITSCWQGGSNCDTRPENYLGEIRENQCDYNDMYVPSNYMGLSTKNSMWQGNELAIFTCRSSDHVPYQYATVVCQHGENFYPHSTAKILANNYEIEERLDQTNRPIVKMGRFYSKRTHMMYDYKISFPYNFDIKNLDQTLPVYFNVYGGPDSQQITKSFRANDFDENFMTSPESHINEKFPETGAIVIKFDARGASNDGDNKRYAEFLKLGQPEIEDIREFASSILDGELLELPSEKILDQKLAIWGWSYGGYFTSHVIGRQDANFNCGISVAPVASWDLYDSIYTERYMETHKENINGYEKSYAFDKTSKNRNDGYFAKYTIIHGTADDNVHFQNSAKLTKSLIKGGFDFDAYFYADENHSIYSSTTTNKHVYRLIWRKMQECYGVFENHNQIKV